MAGSPNNQNAKASSHFIRLMAIVTNMTIIHYSSRREIANRVRQVSELIQLSIEMTPSLPVVLVPTESKLSSDLFDVNLESRGADFRSSCTARRPCTR